MSVIQQFEDRIKEIEKAIQQTILNHTKLVSYLEEAKHWYDNFSTAEPAIIAAIDAIETVAEVTSAEINPAKNTGIPTAE